MGNLSIQAFTIREVTENPGMFDEYNDPHGYASGCNEEWNELLRTNPYAQDSDLALILAMDGNTVVGRLGLYAGMVCLEGRKERTFWLDGFFVANSYRTSGAGGMIILRALSSQECLLASGAPDSNAQKLYKGVSFQEVGPLRRFLFFYRTSVIAKKYIKNWILVCFLSAFTFPLLKLYYRYKTGSSRNRWLLEYRPVEQFGLAMDDLMAQEERNHFPRDSKTLNWILSHRKFWAFEIYRHYELLGYCLLKKSYRKGGGRHDLPPMMVGCLMDYYLANHSREAKEDLIVFSIKFFKGKQVDLFECQVHDETMVDICRKYGLYEIGGNEVFFKPKRSQKVAPDTPWFITFGTSDVILSS